MNLVEILARRYLKDRGLTVPDPLEQFIDEFGASLAKVVGKDQIDSILKLKDFNPQRIKYNQKMTELRMRLKYKSPYISIREFDTYTIGVVSKKEPDKKISLLFNSTPLTLKVHLGENEMVVDQPFSKNIRKMDYEQFNIFNESKKIRYWNRLSNNDDARDMFLDSIYYAREDEDCPYLSRILTKCVDFPMFIQNNDEDIEISPTDYRKYDYILAEWENDRELVTRTHSILKEQYEGLYCHHFDQLYEHLHKRPHYTTKKAIVVTDDISHLEYELDETKEVIPFEKRVEAVEKEISNIKYDYPTKKRICEAVLNFASKSIINLLNIGLFETTLHQGNLDHLFRILEDPLKFYR